VYNTHFLPGKIIHTVWKSSIEKISWACDCGQKSTTLYTPSFSPWHLIITSTTIRPYLPRRWYENLNWFC